MKITFYTNDSDKFDLEQERIHGPEERHENYHCGPIVLDCSADDREAVEANTGVRFESDTLSREEIRTAINFLIQEGRISCIYNTETP